MSQALATISPQRITLDSIRAIDEKANFSATVTTEEVSANVFDYHIQIDFGQSIKPPPMQIDWYVPIVDIVGKWHPTIGSDRSLTANWVTTIKTYATLGAPVVAFFSAKGINRHTFALSDAINPIGIRTQVEEENATINCRIVLFDSEWPEIDSYKITIRIDEQHSPYHKAIGDIGQWWSAMPPYKPAPVPDSAYEPVYSTWYSFHQKLSAEEVEANCSWSNKLGCKSVILDDGWQTEDNNKGYAFCGDWEVAQSKFPDFRSHVARVREIGMQYLVWFSVPFIGPKSRTWETYQEKVLPKDPVGSAACLDPRFASVRQMIIDCYRNAVNDWNIDGLKLDFVDRFTAEKPVEAKDETADMVSVPAAADRLFTDVMAQLRELKPDVLIEFRQAYIGPAMRKYGNIFRAHDCPNDALSNLTRTIDLRLLSGNTAVHSDMVMWNANESVEHAAMQLWATLFSVPQISVKHDAIPGDHEQMLATFLQFWQQRQKLLMHGQLNPKYPQFLYPSVHIENEQEELIAAYQDNHVIEIAVQDPSRKLTIVNATHHPHIIADTKGSEREQAMKIYNCMGECVGQTTLSNSSSIQKIEIPSAGFAVTA
ncbi:MAG: glycoside hydrolase family 36 protein [Puniceicoccales bacterium]